MAMVTQNMVCRPLGTQWSQKVRLAQAGLALCLGEAARGPGDADTSGDLVPLILLMSRVGDVLIRARLLTAASPSPGRDHDT